MRTAFGLVSRDQNIYAHRCDESFLAQLPPELAAEVRASPMGYAWPVDDVMATFEALSGAWHGRDDRIRMAQLGARSVMHGGLYLLGSQEPAPGNGPNGNATVNGAVVEALTAEKGEA